MNLKIDRAIEICQNRGLLSLIGSTMSHVSNQIVDSQTKGIIGIIAHSGIFGLINRCYYTKFFTYTHNSQGINWFERDWDNLILLDACRCDNLSRLIEPEGTMECHESLGSASPESIRANLEDRSLPDTVVMSANGFYQYFDQNDKLDFDLHDMFVVEHTDVWESNDLSDVYDD